MLEPAGQSTPLSSPASCPTRVITPNPSFLQPQSLEWDNLHEGLLGNPRRLGPIEGIVSFPGVSSKRVSATNPNLLEEGRLDYSSLEEDHPEVFDQVRNSWVEKMATEEFKKDLAQLKEIEQDARDLMDDLRVCDMNVWRTKSVDNDLKKIWDLATRF